MCVVRLRVTEMIVKQTGCAWVIGKGANEVSLGKMERKTKDYTDLRGNKVSSRRSFFKCFD